MQAGDERLGPQEIIVRSGGHCWRRHHPRFWGVLALAGLAVVFLLLKLLKVLW
jgi:hypothetical protein